MNCQPIRSKDQLWNFVQAHCPILKDEAYNYWCKYLDACRYLDLDEITNLFVSLSEELQIQYLEDLFHKGEGYRAFVPFADNYIPKEGEHDAHYYLDNIELMQHYKSLEDHHITAELDEQDGEYHESITLGTSELAVFMGTIEELYKKAHPKEGDLDPEAEAELRCYCDHHSLYWRILKEIRRLAIDNKDRKDSGRIINKTMTDFFFKTQAAMINCTAASVHQTGDIELLIGRYRVILNQMKEELAKLSDRGITKEDIDSIMAILDDGVVKTVEAGTELGTIIVTQADHDPETVTIPGLENLNEIGSVVSFVTTATNFMSYCTKEEWEGYTEDELIANHYYAIKGAHATLYYVKSDKTTELVWGTTDTYTIENGTYSNIQARPSGNVDPTTPTLYLGNDPVRDAIFSYSVDWGSETAWFDLESNGTLKNITENQSVDLREKEVTLTAKDSQGITLTSKPVTVTQLQGTPFYSIEPSQSELGNPLEPRVRTIPSSFNFGYTAGSQPFKVSVLLGRNPEIKAWNLTPEEAQAQGMESTKRTSYELVCTTPDGSVFDELSPNWANLVDGNMTVDQNTGQDSRRSNLQYFYNYDGGQLASALGSVFQAANTEPRLEGGISLESDPTPDPLNGTGTTNILNTFHFYLGDVERPDLLVGNITYTSAASWFRIPDDKQTSCQYDANIASSQPSARQAIITATINIPLESTTYQATKTLTVTQGSGRPYIQNSSDPWTIDNVTLYTNEARTEKVPNPVVFTTDGGNVALYYNANESRNAEVQWNKNYEGWSELKDQSKYYGGKIHRAVTEVSGLATSMQPITQGIVLTSTNIHADPNIEPTTKSCIATYTFTDGANTVESQFGIEQAGVDLKYYAKVDYNNEEFTPIEASQLNDANTYLLGKGLVMKKKWTWFAVPRKDAVYNATVTWCPIDPAYSIIAKPNTCELVSDEPTVAECITSGLIKVQDNIPNYWIIHVDCEGPNWEGQTLTYKI